MSEIGERVKKIVVEHLGVEPEKVVDNAASFIEDLGADSLDTVELVMAFEEEFGCEIPDDAAETISDRRRRHEVSRKEREELTLLRTCTDRSRTGRGRAVHRLLCCGPHNTGLEMLDMRRVVVTGLGMVSPLGCGVEATWTRILNGESGARQIDMFDVSDLTSRIACIIPRGDGTAGTFNPDQWMEPKDQRKVDDFIIYAMCAAKQALDDAGWHPDNEADRCATGTMIGSGIGGLSGIADTALLLRDRGPRKVSPFFIPGRLINLASGYVSIEHGLKGPNHAVVTACSTGAHAIGDASRLIALGDADVMVAGGTGIADQPSGHGRLLRFARVVDRLQRQSGKGLAPYDKDRDGFVMGEGAGIVVLEEYEHTKARGARIYAEITGYGMSGDAYHITRRRRMAMVHSVA